MIEDVSFWWWLWSCVTMYLIIFVLHSFSLFVYLDHTCLLVLLSLGKKFVLASPISRNKIELIQNMIFFFQKKAPFDCLSILGTLKFFLDTSLTLQQTYYIPLFFIAMIIEDSSLYKFLKNVNLGNIRFTKMINFSQTWYEISVNPVCTLF